MSSQNQTAWKCDRCGATATTPFRGSSPWTTTATGRKPTGWGRVTIHFFGMREAEDMDLCNPCDVRCHGHVKGTDDSRLLENFWQLAMDYFDRPPGASGNRERADKARFALDLLTRYEDDPTPWYAAGSDDPYPPLLPDEDQFPTSSEHQESSAETASDAASALFMASLGLRQLYRCGHVDVPTPLPPSTQESSE